MRSAVVSFFLRFFLGALFGKHRFCDRRRKRKHSCGVYGGISLLYHVLWIKKTARRFLAFSDEHGTPSREDMAFARRLRIDIPGFRKSKKMWENDG